VRGAVNLYAAVAVLGLAGNGYVHLPDTLAIVETCCNHRGVLHVLRRVLCDKVPGSTARGCCTRSRIRPGHAAAGAVGDVTPRLQ
jgi:hypothetical protein